MNKWITSSNRKRHQRAINSLMRQLNNSIKSDNLWRGRFVVRQVYDQWFRYEDGSGPELYVILRFIDRKTGQYYEEGRTVNDWRFGYGSKMFWRMNDFITERCGVWNEEPRPGTAEYYNAAPYYN